MKKTKKTRRKNISPAPADPVSRYARDVVKGKVVASRLVKLACDRHLRDLKEGKKRGLHWDPDAARRTIGYFREVLRLNGGDFEGRPFILEPSQAFIVGCLFGWKNSEGWRRFRTGYIEQGKGSGKSPLAAGTGLYMLTADGEPRAEVYSAAVDRHQAGILFRDAVAMVDLSPSLDARITRSGGKLREWNLAVLETGSFFRPISSEHSGGRGKSGPRPHCVLLDEVHEHPTNAMVEFMRAGTKGRNQALVLQITNSGFDRGSVCYHYHDYGVRILKGEYVDDSFFAFICGLDPCRSHWNEGFTQPVEDCKKCDDWRNETVWPKANPLIEITPGYKYVREQVNEAIGLPSKQLLVKRLNFCIWTQSEKSWISADIWIANSRQPAPIEDLEGLPCYGGLDLSGKNDLTSLTLVFPDEEGCKDVLCWFWTPKETLAEREKKDRAPYLQWVNEGKLIAVPGVTIDYGFVAAQLGEIQKRFKLIAVAFDRWRIDDLRRELDDQGIEIELVPHGQGFKDMNPAIEALESDLMKKRIFHGGHPVLTSCSANAMPVEDPTGLRKFDKKKSRGRIDGIVTLAMADHIANQGVGSGGSIWDSEEMAVM